MTKKAQMLFLIISIAIISSSVFLSYISIPHLSRSDYVSMLQYDIPHEHDFILKYEETITTKATSESSKEFDDLYDNVPTKKQRWSNYAQLQTAFDKTIMGQYHPLVNWKQLYATSTCNEQEQQQALQEQLRFYNIVSAVFGEELVLKLIQKIVVTNLATDVIAQTKYHVQHNNLTMEYGHDFANNKLINNQYNVGWWAANNIITVSVHEFASALSFYLALNSEQRATLNDEWDSTTMPNNNTNDISSQSLINFLDQAATLTTANKTEKILFPLIIVRSNYGRAHWLVNNNIAPRQLFTEAFVEWLLTPKQERYWNWELLNSYFLHQLPKLIKAR